MNRIIGLHADYVQGQRCPRQCVQRHCECPTPRYVRQPSPVPTEGASFCDHGCDSPGFCLANKRSSLPYEVWRRERATPYHAKNLRRKKSRLPPLGRQYPACPEAFLGFCGSGIHFAKELIGGQFRASCRKQGSSALHENLTLRQATALQTKVSQPSVVSLCYSHVQNI